MVQKIIQVGLGERGQQWVEAINKSQKCSLVACVDISKERLKVIADKYRIDKILCYTDLDEALRQAKADAVLIVTPDATHKNIAIKSLRAGFHVLVEKPFTTNFEDAKKVVAQAKEQNLKLMVTQNYRFRQRIQVVKRLIKARTVGIPGYASVSFSWDKQRDYSPGFFRFSMEDPVVISMAVHHFDMMRYIFDLEPISILARSWNTDWSKFKENAVVSAIIEMENDLWITYSASFVARGFRTSHNGSWNIECSKGGICWKDDVEIYTTDHSKMIKKYGAGIEFSTDTGEDGVLEEFCRAVRDNKKFQCSGEDNLKALSMVFGVIDSSKRKKQVYLKDFL